MHRVRRTGCGALGFLAWMVACLPLFGCQATAGAPGDPAEIVAGVPERFPPHYQLDRQTGKPSGFAVDVLNEVARRGGLRVRYRVYPDWTHVLGAVKSGEINVVPNLGITPERMAFIDYTTPYETFDIAIFVRATTTDIRGDGDLTGRTVAVVADNVGRSLMEQRGGTLVQIHPTQEQAFVALLSGEADALVYPDQVVRKIAREIRIEDRIRQVGEPLAEVKRAIGVRKGDPALSARLDAEVRAFVKTRAFLDMYEKWYGTPEPFWTARSTALALGALLLAAIAVLVIWRYRSTTQLNTMLQHSLAERRRAEQALEQSDARFHLFMRHFPGLAYIKDYDGRVVFASEGFRSYLGLDPAVMPGRTNADLFPAEFADKITRDDQQVLESGRHESHEEAFAGRHWITYKFPLPQPGARPLLGGLTFDNTERKQAEERIRTLNAELERRVKERTAELEAKIAEIERMNKLFVGRELAMVELKQKIRELEDDTGRRER